jgi:hypothetical protein
MVRHRPSIPAPVIHRRNTLIARSNRPMIAMRLRCKYRREADAITIIMDRPGDIPMVHLTNIAIHPMNFPPIRPKEDTGDPCRSIRNKPITAEEEATNNVLHPPLGDHRRPFLGLP